MAPISFETKDGEKYHLGIKEVNSNLITAGSPARVKRIAKHLKNSEVIENERGLTLANGTFENTKITAFCTGMGPSSSAIVLPEILETVENPSTILRVGTAGRLQSRIDLGDLVIATGAVRDEGTTKSIVGSEYPAITDPVIIPIISKVCEDLGYELDENVFEGIIHVKDDLYFKEFPENSPSRDKLRSRLDSYKEMGVLASSMEFSVISIMRDFFREKYDEDILAGCLLSIIADATEGKAGSIDKELKGKVLNDSIKIGLKSLEVVDKIRKGSELGFDLGKMVKKLV